MKLLEQGTGWLYYLSVSKASELGRAGEGGGLEVEGKRGRPHRLAYPRRELGSLRAICYFASSAGKVWNWEGLFSHPNFQQTFISYLCTSISVFWLWGLCSLVQGPKGTSLVSRTSVRWPQTQQDNCDLPGKQEARTSEMWLVAYVETSVFPLHRPENLSPLMGTQGCWGGTIVNSITFAKRPDYCVGVEQRDQGTLFKKH